MHCRGKKDDKHSSCLWFFRFITSHYSLLNTVYGKKSFLSKESDTKILQSIYFTYDVGSGVTDGGQGAEPPPGKLNVKTGPSLLDVLVFSILQFVVYMFMGCFLFLSGVDIQRFTIIS